MKMIVKYVYIISSIIFLFYLLLPEPDFPRMPPNSIRSFEPADVETPLRKAYYTNLSREEVLDYYTNQLNKSPLIGITLPTYKLNYPPEEAKILIRDQTRSTFLEEIVHPFRESFFINGFEPKLDKDKIKIEKIAWRQKVIVRYVPSNTIARLVAGTLITFLIPILSNLWVISIKHLFQTAKK